MTNSTTENNTQTDHINRQHINNNGDGGQSIGLSSTTNERPPLSVVAQQLVDTFNSMPYIKLNGMNMRFEDDTIRCYLDAREDLIGNTSFNILHGGVTATMLDSIGGIVAMLEIYRRNKGTIHEQFKQIDRLATMDFRVDYLTPGVGQQFIASAEIIRLGSKSCTARMQMVNEQNKLIAIGTASFAF